MKVLKIFLVTISVALSSVLFFSCLGDDDGYSLGHFWIDMATVVPLDNNSYYLRMDDGKTLWPAATNVSNYEPKENQRALVNFTILSDSLNGFDHFIKVNSIDNVLTKDIAKNLGEKNDSIYGTDPLEIVTMWTGDNYLNVYFKAYFGGEKKHYINLIPSEDEDAVLELRHNAYDDPATYKRGSLVAFNLSSLEDSTTISNDTILLTVKVNTFDGDKLYSIKFAPSTNTGSKAREMSDVFLEGWR